MQTNKLGWWMGAICVACSGDPGPADTAAGADGDAASTGEAASASSEGTGSDDAAGESGDAPGDPTQSDPGFDLGSQDSKGEGAGDGGDVPRSCTMRECVDTSADAAVSLTPCDEWFGTFFPPYDEHYECWMGGVQGMFGDTGAAFAYDDPDLLIVGSWHGDLAQIRVTRDESCNITGFASAAFEPYDAPEPDDVDVRGMAWLDDGTMLLARTGSDGNEHPTIPQIGQRSPGATTTTTIVDLVGLLPAWPATITYNNPVVSLAVVPEGFPGAGSVKMIAEKPDSAHWHSLTLAADGSGTYDISAAIEATTVYPPEPEWGGYYYRGAAFVGPENPDVDVPSVLITEAWHYIVALYELDADGNPVPETRTPFIEGLGMPSGAALDPVSGNNFAFTGRRSGDVYVIRGCEETSVPDPRG